MQRIQIEFACPHVSDGIWIHSRETRPTRFATILVYCSVRDWTGFCYVIGFENIGIHHPRVIRFVVDLFFFHSGGRIKKYLDSLPNSPDACGQKPYPERKICRFKNIWICVDGALKTPTVECRPIPAIDTPLPSQQTLADKSIIAQWTVGQILIFTDAIDCHLMLVVITHSIYQLTLD